MEKNVNRAEIEARRAEYLRRLEEAETALKASGYDFNRALTVDTLYAAYRKFCRKYGLKP